MNLFRLLFLLFILKWSAGKWFLLTWTVEIFRYQILIAKVLQWEKNQGEIARIFLKWYLTTCLNAQMNWNASPVSIKFLLKWFSDRIPNTQEKW